MLEESGITLVANSVFAFKNTCRAPNSDASLPVSPGVRDGLDASASVQTSDGKYLEFNNQVINLERELDRGGDPLEDFDDRIESLRRSIGEHIQNLDDELFANLISRLSYLRMRRQWETEWER